MTEFPRSSYDAWRTQGDDFPDEPEGEVEILRQKIKDIFMRAKNWQWDRPAEQPDEEALREVIKDIEKMAYKALTE